MGTTLKRNYERADSDWYVEPRWCVEQMADAVDFDGALIWDPACGGGTITDVFSGRGYEVVGTDIVNRGAVHFRQNHDFLSGGFPVPWSHAGRLSIVTNPPFRLAEQFVRQALRLADHRVAILQQLSFLASRQRHALFSDFPPSDVLICSRRPSMPPGHMIAEMGDKAFKNGTADFCWIVWTRPHDREPRVRWLAPDQGAQHDA